MAYSEDREKHEKNRPEELKVLDKRRFTVTGDARDDVIDEVLAKQTAAKESNIAANGAVKNEPGISSDSAASPVLNGEKINGEKKKVNQTSQIFCSFLVGLASQTFSLLGEMPGGEGENLEAAREFIDILGELEKKTDGNLSTEEDKLFKEILSNLRLSYSTKITKKK